MKYKYNYVFFFARYDYDEALLGKETEYIRVYREAFRGNRFLEKLFHYHWSSKINSIAQIPFKRLWFNKMYKQSFNNELPLCFIYMGSNSIRYDGGFCDYVKKKDPRNKQVILHEDLISKTDDSDYQEIKRKVDLCITYDEYEAGKYGIEYFPNCVYQKIYEEKTFDSFEQDVYFLGVAKDRLDKILKVKQWLQSKGLKCKFMIAGVPQDKRDDTDGIIYLDGYIPYKENLRNVIHSKCILEISQQNAKGFSLRAMEALSYGRRLLTDCDGINLSWFNEGQVQLISDIDSINVNVIKEPLNDDTYPLKIDIRPEQRMKFIQSKLEHL